MVSSGIWGWELGDRQLRNQDGGGWVDKREAIMEGRQEGDMQPLPPLKRLPWLLEMGVGGAFTFAWDKKGENQHVLALPKEKRNTQGGK